MTRRGLSIDLAGYAALALAAGSPAFAQSAQDFQLPPGDSTPPAAGPVDPETPGASPTPAPSPTPLPRIEPPAPTAATPPPHPAAATPAPPGPAAARPTAAPAFPAPPVALPTAPAVEAPGISTLPSTPAATEAAPLPPAPEGSSESLPAWLWPALGGSAALLLGLALVIWRARRSRAARLAAAEEWPEEAQPAPPPPAAPQPLPPIPQPSFAPPPTAPAAPPAPAAAPASFELMLEPQRMTLAMINATLVYRLAIANRGAAPLGPLRITCDMISAHASLAAAEQLDPDPEKAWLSHEFEAIPPGETIMIDGELRLPRAEIRPVRSGAASLFVPLARFTLQTLAGGRPAPIGARVFVIGEEPEQPGGPVKPFRLNEGSRSYSRVSQREVVITS